MASDDVCDASTMTLLLQNDCDCLWIPSSSATLHEPVVNFENIGEKPTLETPFFQPIVKEENGDEDLDVCFVPPGKKRRLSSIQVQFLEKSFEVENKLEPERKIQLAKDLGLQPRQVAIWFQNRRARYKNKQLEKDYDCLKSSYDKLKSDYDNLHKQNEDLRNEVLCLKKKLLNGEKMTQKLDQLDRIDAHNGDFPAPNSVFEKDVNVPFVTFKQEDANSAKSEILDSDSPRSFLEPDSSHILEPDQSDFSQDEEDDLCRNFLPQSYFPKLCHDPIANSCNFEFPTMDDQPIWSGLPELSFSI